MVRATLRTTLRSWRAHPAGLATPIIGTISVIALLTAATTAWRSESFDTITVHQVRVVDADGTLRLLLANQEHFPAGVVRGKPLDSKARSVGSAASMFFYNRNGSEQGALRWDGQQKSSTVRDSYQYEALSLDQLEGNDNLILSYGEQDGGHGASLQGAEQPATTPLDTLNMQWDTVGRTLTDSAARRAAREKFRVAHYVGRSRFYIGYTRDQSAVRLSDAHGRARLELRVDKNGRPMIQFLDSLGVVVRTIEE